MGMADASEHSRVARILTKLFIKRQWLQLFRNARPSATQKKPGELIHGVDDVPSPLLITFVGFQHISLVRIQLIYPALVIQAAGLPISTSVNMLQPLHHCVGCCGNPAIHERAGRQWISLSVLPHWDIP